MNARRVVGHIGLILLMVPRTVTATQGQDLWEDHRPVISPDGRTLAFMSDRSGTWAIYLMPLDASPPPVRVSDDPRGEWYPDWAPAGTELVYHRSDPARDVVFLRRFNVASGTEEALGPTDGTRDFARWSHDGRTIYYLCRGAGVCRMSSTGEEQGSRTGHRRGDR